MTEHKVDYEQVAMRIQKSTERSEKVFSSGASKSILYLTNQFVGSFSFISPKQFRCFAL
jgi:hypothetical protein